MEKVRILLTAFEPYDEWTSNSSWLALVEFLRDYRPSFELVTRRYPVELNALRDRLRKDLDQSFDAVLHLGQSPGTAAIKLESVALNFTGYVGDKGKELPTIVTGGPVAFQSKLPIGSIAEKLVDADIPAYVSYHAGTFLCNATMYLTHYWMSASVSPPPVGFIHLPLATEQVAHLGRVLPSLPTKILAQAVGLILDEVAAIAKAPSAREFRTA